MESLSCGMMSSYHNHSILYGGGGGGGGGGSSRLRVCACTTNGGGGVVGGGGKVGPKINGTTAAEGNSSSSMLVPSISLGSPLSISSLLTQKAAEVFTGAAERSYALSEAVLVLLGVSSPQIPPPATSRASSEDTLHQGRIVEDVVYRQTFVVRSYEAGADRTATLETFLNLFQETALNHVLISGLAGNGFGATREMIRKELIWVVSRMQVKVEKYPAWGDALEIDTWVGASGKNGMRRDWLVRDFKTGAILARATSTWVMMHKHTRRLSKMPDEVRGEITPWFLTRTAFFDESARKIEKLDHTSQYRRSGLTPRHSDLDMNQHVNNVKYLSWMMESLPPEILETHQVVGITLEYRKECGKSDIVESLTSSSATSGELDSSMLEFTHLLRMEKDGSEIVRARTAWRSRQHQQQGTTRIQQQQQQERL